MHWPCRLNQSGECKLRFIKFIMLPKLFHAHGLFCASHPWEVIVFTLTLTLCVLSMGSTLNDKRFCVWSRNCANNDFNKNADVVFMTITRCMAVLCIYHQFNNLRKLGSKYIIGIAGLFAVFSSFVFSSSVINFLQGDLAELNEALPFFFLLIDLAKASLLAQYALTSSNQEEVRDNIARGMALLGPTITLDTVVETLVIGVGTLSGVQRLEIIGCFACLSVIVNYLVFMTFFPACLSLVLEVSRDRNDSHPVWHFTRALKEEEQKPNPVLQRVKLIMSAGLVLVHAHSRWPLFSNAHHSSDGDVPDMNASYIDEDSTLGRWLTVSPNQIVMLIVAFALAVKYIFFESRDNVAQMISVNFESREVQDRIQQDQTSSSSSISVGSSPTVPSILQLTKLNLETKMTQTDESFFIKDKPIIIKDGSEDACCEIAGQIQEPLRSLNECVFVLKKTGAQDLKDNEVIMLVESRHIAAYQLERVLNNAERAVDIRRKIIMETLSRPNSLNKLPFSNYDYSYVMGVCCENVIGYMPVPVGAAGPLLINGQEYYIPMATTEGCLVASTNRGCNVLMKSGGVRCRVLANKMTRGPVVSFASAERAAEVVQWLEIPENFERLKESFDSTSRFARLQRLKPQVAGHYVFIRFEAFTADAMGMNMLSKGTETALKTMQNEFSDMKIVSLSGNFCTDKKAAAINWIEGRGKYVVCEAIVPGQLVRQILKTNVSTLIETNTCKNLIGSSLAGTIGGNNAQAANIVTAIYIATGQDPAQSVTSSNCITQMESRGTKEENLYITCTMPSIEVGTVGGGTLLPPQAACLELLGVRGPCIEEPGKHAETLAGIVAGAVLAGELSLMAALSAGHLVESHMQHNRPNSVESSEENIERKSSSCQVLKES